MCLHSQSSIKAKILSIGFIFEYQHCRFYNQERPHQCLAYRTPAEVHFGEHEQAMDMLKFQGFPQVHSPFDGQAQGLCILEVISQ